MKETEIKGWSTAGIDSSGRLQLMPEIANPEARLVRPSAAPLLAAQPADPPTHRLFRPDEHLRFLRSAWSDQSGPASDRRPRTRDRKSWPVADGDWFDAQPPANRIRVCQRRRRVVTSTERIGGAGIAAGIAVDDGVVAAADFDQRLAGGAAARRQFRRGVRLSGLGPDVARRNTRCRRRPRLPGRRPG